MLAERRSRLTFCLRLAMPVRPALCFVFMLLGLLSSQALGQPVEPPPGEPSLMEQQELGRIALQHLRVGDHVQALKSLEPAGEWPARTALAEAPALGPACAGLHRALSQLGYEEQYDLLKSWTIPASSKQVRVLTALVPTGAPPAEFARVLGERPRATSFPVASIGNVRGIYSSAWSLVTAARETGRLKKLIGDLTPLVDNKVPNADLLLALAQIVDGRGENPKLQEQLSQRAGQIKAVMPATGVGPKFVDSGDLVLAAACLQHPSMRPVSETLFDALLARTYGQTATALRPFLRYAQGTAVLVNRGQSDAALSQQFKYWIPAAGDLTGASPLWPTHDEHILHLAGSGYDILFFRYPLHGDFQFHCDTHSGGDYDTEGGLVFGGFHYQPLSGSFQLSVSDFEGVPHGKRFCHFVYPGRRPTFHHLSIDSSHAATMSVNRHTMWHDPDAICSPWLGLRGLDERRPLFRNFKLTGNPIIPRSVSLAMGDALRGWQNLVDGDVKPAAGPSGWIMTAGVIQSTGALAATSRVENLLSFHRPLAGGESVSYEFFHAPGAVEISPALGRVVFLLSADGVRLHWMTSGRREWTGLDAENAVVEPLNRRGPRQLPFKANAWNRLTLARAEKSLTLSLNDVVIYQRPIDWTGDFRFGLFRNRAGAGVQNANQPQTAAQIRNVVLTGDWPERVPQEFHENPTATAGDSLATVARHALNRIFREDFLLENVFAVRRRALALPPVERFEFLSRWVLPGPEHPGFRVTGDFTPTRPAPAALEPGAAEPELGGQIVSPVYDWLDVARELGRLAECRERVESAAVVIADLDPEVRANGLQDRAQAALLMLLGIEQGDAPAIAAAFEKLYPLLKAQTPVGIEDQWPETLAADRGLSKQANLPGIQELISYLHAQRVLQWRPKEIGIWHTHVAALAGRMQRRNSPAVADPRAAEFKEWIPVVAARSAICGQGFPNPHWQRRGSLVIKRAGNDEDFLLYRQPLKGDFEVECDLLDPGSYPTQVLLAGTFTGLRWDLKHLDVGTIRGAGPLFPLEKSPPHQGTVVRFRGVVRDGKRTVYLNGLPVQSDALPRFVDPWIAIRGWGRLHSRLQNFRITGQPTVIDAAPLSASEDLTGWNLYHPEEVGGPVGGWKHIEDPQSTGIIVGHSNPGLAGNHAESLLRYYRPLVEDGTIDYEFFYKPGTNETHPALDRLALLLEPSGIREHWITDHRYDRTELAPDNIFERPENRRGKGALPLKADDWNRVRLTLRGSTLALNLNGQLVYERELEPANQRTFGLFHYVDKSEVRARNVVMRGEWPKSLLPVAEQELAGEWNTVDADLTRLAASFTHDFEKDGLPDKYFRHQEAPANNVQISFDSTGLRVGVQATGVWASIDVLPRFTVSGDFDIEATFANLQSESQQREAGIILMTCLNDPRKSIYGISRILTQEGFQGSQLSTAQAQADGSRSWVAEMTPNAAAAGRLRLARRGDRLHYLFAEEDSEIFRTFHTQQATDADMERDGLRLHALCTHIGKTDVVWKKLVIRAERMTWYPELSQPETLKLRVMNSDGTGLKTILAPAALGLTSLGSPEWSPDGSRIALDVSTGSTSTSRIVVLDADGSNVKDLGLGCMPSFSRDGSRIILSQPGQGVVMMKSDGTGREVIDRSAWGAQWSPDGKSIAYIKGANITLLDVETRQNRQLLKAEAASRYNYLFWALGWSNDGRFIAFKAQRNDGKNPELCVVEVATGEFKVLHNDASTMHVDFMWSPDNEKLIASFHNPDAQGPQLFSVSVKNPGPLQLLPAQPRHYSHGYCWSRDGKKIAITSTQIPQPVKWVTGPVEEPTEDSGIGSP